MKHTATFGLLLLLALAGLVAFAASPSTADWPAWRGPLATGVAPGAEPPLTWSETENVSWKVAVPGKGLATPIVSGKLVILTTAVPAGQRPDPGKATEAEADLPEWRQRMGVAPSEVLEFSVLAYDRKTGKLRWSTPVRKAAPHEGTHTDGSWASQSPVTNGKLIVAHFGSNGTFALDMQGKQLWERDLGDMETRRGFGEGSSPVIHGDTVVINWDHEGDSFLVALDLRTGETRWKADRPDEVTSWSTPLVVESAGRTQVVVAATGKTRGYDLASGKLLWEVGGMTTNTIPSPVESAGRVFVMSGFRGNALQAIDVARAKGELAADAEAIAWTFDQDTPYVPSPLLYNDRLYFLKHNKGILSCFDATSGKRLYGPERLEGLEGVYASPVGAAGRVYVVGRNGTTVVLEDGAAPKVLARNVLDDGFDASPAVAGSELYLRGREHLYRIAAK